MEKTEKPRFRIITKMEKKERRKYMYYCTFFQSKLLVPYFVAMSMLGAYLIWEDGETIFIFFLKMFLLSVFAMVGVCIMVERKNKKRIAKEGGDIDISEVHWKFYDDRLCYENDQYKIRWEENYDKMDRVLESKNCFFIFIKRNQVSFLPKKDIRELNNFQKFLKEKFPQKYKKI